MTPDSKTSGPEGSVTPKHPLLGPVYALLALIGIEVGMKRRQIRAMIRSESVILSLFGAVIGIIVGTGLGLALVLSLHSQGISSTVVPVSNLVIFLIIAGVLGLIAASWPARRAARLDVLEAIASL